MKKALLVFAFMLFSLKAFADSTTYYSLTKPTVGGSPNVWGTQLNSNFDTIDSNLWNASGGLTTDVTINTSASSNITLSNPIKTSYIIGFTSTGKKLIMPPANETKSPVVGSVVYVKNGGSNAFAITAQDGSTNIVSSLPAGEDVYLQLTSGSTANGTWLVKKYGDLMASTASSTYAPINNANLTGTTTIANLSVSGGALVSGTATASMLNVTGTATVNNLTITGNAVGVTATAGDSSTKLATTEFVSNAIGSSANGMVLLQTAVLTGQSEIAFTGLDNNYSAYLFEFSYVRPSTTANINMVVSNNNGSTWVNTGYYAAVFYLYHGSIGLAKGTSITNGSSIMFGYNQSSNSNRGMSGEVWLFEPGNTSVYKTGKFDVVIMDATDGLVRRQGLLDFDNSTSAINAVKFYPGAGNFASGSIRMYGLKK